MKLNLDITVTLTSVMSFADFSVRTMRVISVSEQNQTSVVVFIPGYYSIEHTHMHAPKHYN